MKKFLSALIALIMMLSLTACNAKESVSKGSISTENTPKESISTDIEWTIYWYLCGSDLETNHGAATNDLAELLEVELPENVKVLIQTDGASAWQNDFVNADKLGRYIYDHNGLQLIEELPSANMGETKTLEDFLSLVEMYQAFSEAFGENPQNQPIDIIGFDTCLMATVDTAYTFSDIAKYLVASQEVEPGNGWLYSGWIGALAKTPNMEALELSKIICDSYAQESKAIQI